MNFKKRERHINLNIKVISEACMFYLSSQHDSSLHSVYGEIDEKLSWP